MNITMDTAVVIILAIVAIIVVVKFWRIFAPVIAVLAVGICSLYAYQNAQDYRRVRNREVQAERARIKLQEATAKLRAAASNPDLSWAVAYRTNPATGELVPATAWVRSDDGMFEIRFELRGDGTKLIGLYALDEDVEFADYSDDSEVEVQFSNWPFSKTMKARNFSDGSDIYIGAQGYGGVPSLDGFIENLRFQDAVAIQVNLKHIGEKWIRFTLTGGRKALGEMGVE